MTEKNYNPEQRTEKTMKKQEKMQKMEKPETPKQGEGGSKEIEKKGATEIREKGPDQVREKPKVKEKPKRTKVIINAFDIPISTKHSSAICRFIKKKGIQEAVRDLELVAGIKKPVPMRGEIPHRKGRMMSGRFPEKAAKEFMVLLKSLSSNSVYHGIENPVITEAMANIGSRPFGRGGIRRKRTHIRIVAEEKKSPEENTGKTENK